MTYCSICQCEVNHYYKHRQTLKHQNGGKAQSGGKTLMTRNKKRYTINNKYATIGKRLIVLNKDVNNSFRGFYTGVWTPVKTIFIKPTKNDITYYDLDVEATIKKFDEELGRDYVLLQKYK